MRKRPGSLIASDAASFSSLCRTHYGPTITRYHVPCVLGTYVLQLPELGYWKHGSKQHVEGTACVGVAQGRSLAHQPHTFEIEQWQALLQAWQDSHTVIHTIPFAFSHFQLLFYMFHHVSSFFPSCFIFHVSSFFYALHRMLPAMLETCHSPGPDCRLQADPELSRTG